MRPGSLNRRRIVETLWRGLRRRCPQCGEGKLFQGCYNLVHRCPLCGCDFLHREGDCWWFMYITTAFLTGLLVIGMFLIRPSNLLLGQILVVAGGLAVMGLTLPFRKGVAIAFDYLIDQITEET